MSNIVLKNVCKSYDKEHYAVQDFSLEIPDREFVIFVGPSGCYFINGYFTKRW